MTGFLLSANFCVAQTMLQPPTDTDLHAAYCIFSLQNDIKYAQTALSQLNSATPTPQVDNLRKTYQSDLSSADANLNRLQLYLLPRLSYIDSLGLLGASASAADDIHQIINAVNQCAVTDAECVHRSVPDLRTIQDKLQACRNLTWLPF